MYRIASTNNEFPGVEDVRFNSPLSLTDFDIVIVNPDDVYSSYPKSEVGQDNRQYIVGRNAYVVREVIDRRMNEFHALAKNGKIIISFLNHLSEVVISRQNLPLETIDNYSWIPDGNLKMFTQQMINGRGSGVKLIEKKHLFSLYYLAFQNDLIFDAYVDTTQEFFTFGDAFILNSANRIIGFSSKISNGLIAFLPKFKPSEENNKKFVGVLVQIAKKYFGAEMKSPPPDWVNNFAIPGIDIIDEKIHTIEEQITELEHQKSEFEIEKSSLNDYKFLLYEQGHTLQNKVLDTLRLLGFKAETVIGENTDFDVVLEADEGRAIAEVEGKDDNAVHKEKIDQLLSAINQDAEQRETFAKGILIGNSHRIKSPEQREEPFTKTAMNLAKQYHYALLTTIELYNAAIYFLQCPDDEACKKACRKALFETDGNLVKFPIPEKHT